MVKIATNRSKVIVQRTTDNAVVTVAKKGPDGGAGPPGPSGDTGLAINLGTVTGAINLSTYNLASQVFSVTTGGALTLSSTQMPVVASGYVGSFTLRILQGTTTGTLTLTGIKASYGNYPTLSTTAGAIDLITFMYTGTEWVALPTGVAIQ